MRRLIGFYRDAYVGLPANIWWLCAVAFVNRSGTMVVPFLTLWLTQQLGYPVGDAGMLMACFGTGSMFGWYLGGWLTDRIGPIRVQVGSFVLGGLLFVALGSLQAFASIAVTLFLIGLIGDAFRPANLAMIASNAPTIVRAKAFALLRLALNLGWAIGPTIGGFLARIDYDLLFWIDGATCALAGLLLFALRARFRTGQATSTDPLDPPDRSPLRDPTFLAVMGCSLVVAIVFMQFLFTAPLHYSRAYHLDERAIGVLSGLNAVIIVLTEMVLIHRLRHHRPLRLVAAGALLTGVGFGLNGLMSTFWGGALAVTVWTCGEMLESPSLMSWTASRAGAASRGRYMAVLTILYSVAFLLSPVIGSWVYEKLGAGVLWGGSAVLGTVAAAAIWWVDARDRQSAR